MKDSSDVLRSFYVNGEMLPYRVERRAVRCPRLEFRGDELLVILPRSLKDENQLLEEKRRWISKKLLEINQAVKRLGASANGRLGLPILGDFFEFRRCNSLVFDDERKVIECDPTDASQIGRFSTILKRMLLRELQDAVNHYSKKFDVNFKGITIRKQRTKWGSCSSKGNLSFNLWLVCLPRDLIWYLACHEVAHLKERNHRKGFWRLVGSKFENYRYMEKKLSEHWFFIQKCYGEVFNSGRGPF